MRCMCVFEDRRVSKDTHGFGALLLFRVLIATDGLHSFRQRDPKLEITRRPEETWPRGEKLLSRVAMVTPTCGGCTVY